MEQPMSGNDLTRESAPEPQQQDPDQLRTEAEHQRKAAEETLREKHLQEEFLALLAHELRNPLAPLRNGVQILRQNGTRGPLAERTLDMIERQLQHLTRMVEDLLDVSRLRRGKFSLRKEAVDLISVARDAVETCRPVIDGREHQLSLHLPQAPLHVAGDRVRLIQVISNLLINAARYTETRGQICLSVDREGECGVVRVTDTGIGIPEHMLSRIFDLFAQADRPANGSIGGLGLGLTLVRRLVELHSGTVSARSEGPGRGSEFIVSLPLASEKPPERERIPLPASVRSGRRLRRVLVVEDNPDTARSMAAVLRLWGHDVATAYDGRKALEVAQRHNPEFVFLDIGLPLGMDGYEVARRLRTLPGMERALLVAVTGFGQPEHCQRSHEAGIQEHLIKPIDPTDLQRILATEE
jgi:CheY-like chemotaxis protein